MKRKLLVILACGVLSMSLFGCGASDNKGEGSAIVEGSDSTEVADSSAGEDVDATVYKLGDAIETDILGLTLNKAQLTIKMNGKGSSSADGSNYKTSPDYFLADEYNPETDAGLAYVAPKGHTYVAIEYRVKNLDRASVEFEGSFNPEFITIKYDGQEYGGKGNTVIGWESEDGVNGGKYSSSNILLMAGEEKTYRCYVDIPVDADLMSDFEMSFYLPKSDGSTKRFNYSITADDRQVLENQEISLDDAILKYPDTESKEYFENHKDDFEKVDDIGVIVKNEKFHVDEVFEYGSGEYYYVFEDSGMIKETALNLSDKPTGYLNNLKWSADGSDLSIVGEKSTSVYTMYKIGDNTYIGYSEGNPWLLLSK